MKLKALIIIFLCSLAFIQSGIAQIIKDDINMADEAFKDGDYYGASIYYYKVLLKDTSKLNIAYKYAESCRLFNNYSEAAIWYAYVTGKDEKEKFPLSIFYNALMLKDIGRYPEAKEIFTKYYSKHRLDRDYFSKKANVEIEACDFAVNNLNDSIKVNIEHLGHEINSPYSEFGAVQLKDSLLVFSSLRYVVSDESVPMVPDLFQSKVYSSIIDDTEYRTPEAFSRVLNETGVHTANISFTRDHKTAYFTKCKAIDFSGLRCEIYRSTYKEGIWEKPEKLNNMINMHGYTSTHPFIVEGINDDVLYFVSDRPGGQGNLDIWYSRIRRGKFYSPFNAGRNVNTPGNEITPFYHYKTSTFYFSSDWQIGFGGFDIFRSSGGQRKRNAAENIGHPLNSSYNDLYFTINSDDSTGYFTSNRPGSFFIKGETCCNDLYFYDRRNRIEIEDSVLLSIDTADIEQTIKQLLPLTLYFHNDEPDPRTTKTTTNKNYENVLSNYFSLKNKYKKEYSRGLVGEEKLKAQQDIEAFFENELSHGFSDLNEFARLLLKDLRKESQVKITVKGYTSPLNTKEYNINLAKRRISSLKNFIYEYDKGIFNKYLSSTDTAEARLEIHEVPIGEEQAAAEVSDNPNDKRNAVYSRAAALERRIQIIMYSSDNNNSHTGNDKTTEIKLNEDFIDFGNVVYSEQASFSLQITNIGVNDLIISNIEPSCGCTIFELPEGPVQPGNSIDIKVFFDTHETMGEQNEFLTIYLNTKDGVKNIFISANVIEK